MNINHVHTDTTADLSAPGATIGVTLPSGSAADLAKEICILTVASGRSTTSPPGTWTAPAGWTSIFTAFSVDNTGFGGLGLQAFWALASNANLTFTKSGTIDFTGWVAATFSGVDLSTPIDVTANTQSNISAASLTVASLTIATGKAIDFIVGADWHSGGVFSTVNIFYRVNGNTNQSCALGYDPTFKLPGATGTAVFANSGAASGQALVAARFALRPSEVAVVRPDYSNFPAKRLRKVA